MSMKAIKNGKEYPIGVIPQNVIDAVGIKPIAHLTGLSIGTDTFTDILDSSNIQNFKVIFIVANGGFCLYFPAIGTQQTNTYDATDGTYSQTLDARVNNSKLQIRYRVKGYTGMSISEIYIYGLKTID